ncbi:hypothetical protein [Magnetospirillum gryphiswaldense]|nr:hypothetical protein [Magnetospirillum gryphiswaldense]
MNAVALGAESPYTALSTHRLKQTLRRQNHTAAQGRAQRDQTNPATAQEG